ncbi:MAG: cyclase family protein [Bacillota bacterium]|nr:cyclase family protein [Bacillota bacterium]
MFIELTHKMEEEMPVYPGTERPVFDKSFTIEKNGFAETQVRMFSHTGTHMDAPAHMVLGGKTLDEYPVEHFIGEAYILDLTNGVPGIRELEADAALIEKSDFIIMKTGWSKKWGMESYFNDFPVLNEELLDYLLQFDIRGFGVDAISVDPVSTTTFDNHMKMFAKECTIVENLKNLESIPQKNFKIIMLPLLTKDSDGFSARVVAEV